MLKDRDRAILQKIVIYCQQIEQTVARFGADFILRGLGGLN